MTKKEYSVGYKKPPQNKQFKPGKSGNPRGRPKGTKNLATDLHEELSSRITVVEGDKTQSISKQKALVKSLSNKALKGDVRAMKLLVKMIERNIPDEVEEEIDEPISESDEILLKEFLARSQKKGEENE